MDPVDIALSLHRALEAGAHGEALRPLFTDDAETVEHPNLVRPAGSTARLEQMLAASTSGAALLAEQRYALRAAHSHGPLAVLRVGWTGVVARDAGPLRAGQLLTAELAQFIETRAGRIARIETFDCYAPLA